MFVFRLRRILFIYFFFFFNDTATTEIYTLSLHDALPIWKLSDIPAGAGASPSRRASAAAAFRRSEEHTSELQSRSDLVCRLLLEKKKRHTCRRTRHADHDKTAHDTIRVVDRRQPSLLHCH